MLIGGLLKFLLGLQTKTADYERKTERPLTQKEKDELEYRLWEMAEEYREER